MPDKECFLWFAGSYIGPGQEVCNSYKYMLNDRSLFQYGFLQVSLFGHLPCASSVASTHDNSHEGLCTSLIL
jgi:hypothetical protein